MVGSYAESNVLSLVRQSGQDVYQWEPRSNVFFMERVGRKAATAGAEVFR